VLVRCLCGAPSLFFLFADAPTSAIYTLSLHDALPISLQSQPGRQPVVTTRAGSSMVPLACVRPYSPNCSRRSLRAVLIGVRSTRSEEHTSELQSRENLVCRLLLEKKKKTKITTQERHN